MSYQIVIAICIGMLLEYIIIKLYRFHTVPKIIEWSIKNAETVYPNKTNIERIQTLWFFSRQLVSLLPDCQMRKDLDIISNYYMNKIGKDNVKLTKRKKQII